MNDRQTLNPAEVAEQLSGDFRQLLGSIYTRYRTDDFAAALELANAVGEAAEEMNHHPDLDLRWGRLDIRMRSHDVDGLTARDLRLADRISQLASAAGARPDTASLMLVEIGLDTWAAPEVSPFWQALLGYDAVGDQDLVDPLGANPTVWFQITDEHSTPRQRFHLDVWVPVDVAEERLTAAVNAGGTLLDDSNAPSFWVLADPHGNKACICTVKNRDA